MKAWCLVLVLLAAAGLVRGNSLIHRIDKRSAAFFYRNGYRPSSFGIPRLKHQQFPSRRFDLGSLFANYKDPDYEKFIYKRSLDYDYTTEEWFDLVSAVSIFDFTITCEIVTIQTLRAIKNPYLFLKTNSCIFSGGLNYKTLRGLSWGCTLISFTNSCIFSGAYTAKFYGAIIRVVHQSANLQFSLSTK